MQAIELVAVVEALVAELRARPGGMSPDTLRDISALPTAVKQLEDLVKESFATGRKSKLSESIDALALTVRDLTATVSILNRAHSDHSDRLDDHSERMETIHGAVAAMQTASAAVGGHSAVWRDSVRTLVPWLAFCLALFAALRNG